MESNYEHSGPIARLIQLLHENEDKLWASITQLVKYKKDKYSRKLYNPLSGQGIIKDIETAQDKYIDTLCKFGLKKEELVYILSDNPTHINEIKIDVLSSADEQSLSLLEFDFAYAIRTIKKNSILDITKQALAALLRIDLPDPTESSEDNSENNTPVQQRKIRNEPKKQPKPKVPKVTKTSKRVAWPGEEAERAWLNLTRREKQRILTEMWINRDPYEEFVTLEEKLIEPLYQRYQQMQYLQDNVSAILERDSTALQRDGKFEKISKYANEETQCRGIPAFFGNQAQNDVWEYARAENSEYFTALQEYTTVKDILTKIDAILQTIATPQGKRVYLEKLIETIVQFDQAVTSRTDLKQWLYNEVKAFLDLWQVFRTKHLNLSLEGPPGSGKTTIAERLGPIFSRLGILLLGKYRIVSTSDLVGQYVGETANKVKGILTSMLESVLFIDEAYAVACRNPIPQEGPPGQIIYDQYGIEAINELVNFLDKNAGNIMVIVAGYQRDMQYCFFGANSGLERRFPKRYILVDMPAQDLRKVLLNRLRNIINEPTSSTLTPSAQSCVERVFDATPMYWINQAGDMNNLAEKLAAQKASKGAPLTDADVNETILEMFQNKDLSRMQTLPRTVDRMENWSVDRIQTFLDKQTYLLPEEKDALGQMLKTGDRLASLTSDDVYWLNPVSEYNLIATINEEKGKTAKRIKDFFNDQVQEYCTPSKFAPQIPLVPESVIGNGAERRRAPWRK